MAVGIWYTTCIYLFLTGYFFSCTRTPCKRFEYSLTTVIIIIVSVAVIINRADLSMFEVFG